MTRTMSHRMTSTAPRLVDGRVFRGEGVALLFRTSVAVIVVLAVSYAAAVGPTHAVELIYQASPQASASRLLPDPTLTPHNSYIFEPSNSHTTDEQHHVSSSSSSSRGVASQAMNFFDHLRGGARRAVSSLGASNSTSGLSAVAQQQQQPALDTLAVNTHAKDADNELVPADDSDLEEETDDEEDDDDEDADSDEEEDEEDEDEKEHSGKTAAPANTNTQLIKQTGSEVPRMLTDLFGNKIRLDHNRTILVSQKRDLGLLAIKAILLGPLIGLTIKAALIRGLLWAVGAYFLHLFFPSLLSTLGLGTGLVGFARQLQQPNYAQMMLPLLAELPSSVIPNSMNRIVNQYPRVFAPIVDSISAVPAGHCRYRAVCETASYLVRQAHSMSTSLQRISATVYLNFGTEYSKAWLDGIVQSNCAQKYPQCEASPFSMMAARLSEAISQRSSLPPQPQQQTITS